MPKAQPLDVIRANFAKLSKPALVDECVRLSVANTALRRERAQDVRYVDGAPLEGALSVAQWTNLELAAALGLNKSTVSLWIRGKMRLTRGRAEQLVILFREYGQAPPAFPELKGSDCYTRPVTRKDADAREDSA